MKLSVDEVRFVSPAEAPSDSLPFESPGASCCADVNFTVIPDAIN